MMVLPGNGAKLQETLRVRVNLVGGSASIQDDSMGKKSHFLMSGYFRRNHQKDEQVESTKLWLPAFLTILLCLNEKITKMIIWHLKGSQRITSVLDKVSIDFRSRLDNTTTSPFVALQSANTIILKKILINIC